MFSTNQTLTAFSLNLLSKAHLCALARQITLSYFGQETNFTVLKIL